MTAIQRIKLMGIVNVTPDSFSDGGRFITAQAAIQHGLKLIAAGADALDIGGESSRPGAQPVSVQTELTRVLPVIKGIRKFNPHIPISIDTYKPVVAQAALQAGATWINDITGLKDPVLRTLVAKAGCKVILMHMLGDPQTMQRQPRYHDVVSDIKKFFRHQLKLALASGVKPRQIILDPGIGFGKTIRHNLEILQRLTEFKVLGYPILIGASRKSFIGKLTGAAVNDRLPGTLAAHALAVANGATWLRVHDVAEHRQFFRLLK